MGDTRVASTGCPWCGEKAGFRDASWREIGAPLLISSVALGVRHLRKFLSTPAGTELTCLACGKQVHRCPRCDHDDRLLQVFTKCSACKQEYC